MTKIVLTMDPKTLARYGWAEVEGGGSYDRLDLLLSAIREGVEEVDPRTESLIAGLLDWKERGLEVIIQDGFVTGTCP